MVCQASTRPNQPLAFNNPTSPYSVLILHPTTEGIKLNSFFWSFKSQQVIQINL